MFCTNCGLSLGDVRFCGNCGARVSKDEPSIDSGEKLDGKGSLGWLKLSPEILRKRPIIFIAGAVALVGIVFLAGGFGNADIRECKSLVLESLKDPGSAGFSATEVEYSTSGKDGSKTVSVTGIVRAKNGFGAVVPGEFWCTNFNTEDLELEYLTNP